MAVILSINYTKKLGLPQYSSHSCSISVQVEVNDLAQVQEESRRLYNLLQNAVDAEIQKVGFMPDTTYGIGDNNGATNGNGAQPSNGHRSGIGSDDPRRERSAERWICTEGQRGLILRIVNENQLDKAEVESLAQKLFRVGVKECNKMQASQLIEELLEKVGKKTSSRGSRWRNNQPASP